MTTVTPINQARRGRGRPKKTVTESVRNPKPAIPAELIYFDSLPDSAYVRLPVVMGLYGIKSPSTIWRNVKRGLIPAPVKLTPNLAGWNVGELRAALNVKAIRKTGGVF
jgi:predicted DNA-binding transcriptional regulator AlpA